MEGALTIPARRLSRSGQPVCGFGDLRNRYRYKEVMVSTNYMKSVPLKVKIDLLENNAVNDYTTSDLMVDDKIISIILETQYCDTFIKVIDVNTHNLNPNVVYPVNYLLSLTSVRSDPNIKNYAHDVLFNAYNFLCFLNKNKIEFKYDNLILLINIPELDNAYWNGYYLSFGAGTESHKPLVSAMITGHELSHALIESVCNLQYEGQSGALNESFADVIGVCYEFYIHEIYNSLGWEIGSECNFLLRNMQYPHLCQQPEVENDVYYMDPLSYVDNGGVHINSGIPNHVFYCIQEKVGYKKAFELFVRVLFKLTPYSNFKDFKNTMITINTYLIVLPKDTMRVILETHFRS